MKTVIPIIILVLVAVVVFSGAFYTVDETEQAVITQFGRPVGGPELEPGLHFKTPFIQKANKFPKNILEWDGDPGEIPSLDKTMIYVDTFARWRIVDPLKYFKRVNNEGVAQSRLDSILNAETKNLIQSLPLIETIRNSGREMEILTSKSDKQQMAFMTEIEVGREKMTQIILEKAQPKMLELGIELIDVGIKRINYNEAVQQNVFERMIAERKQMAQKYRSEGQGEARDIEGKMEKDLKTIQAEAYRKSQEFKGKADAEAASIYAVAYGKDSEFYKLVRTLEIYKNLPEKEIDMVLSTDSDLFKYIKGIKP